MQYLIEAVSARSPNDSIWQPEWMQLTMSVAHVALMIAQCKQLILVWASHLHWLSRMVGVGGILWHPSRQVEGVLSGGREDDRRLGLVVKQPSAPCNETLEVYQKYWRESRDTKGLGSSSRLLASRAVPALDDVRISYIMSTRLTHYPPCVFAIQYLRLRKLVNKFVDRDFRVLAWQRQ